MKLDSDITNKGKWQVRRKGSVDVLDSHNEFKEAVQTANNHAPGDFEIIPPSMIEYRLRFVDDTPVPPVEPEPDPEPPPPEEPDPPTGDFKGFDLPELVYGEAITGSAPSPLPGLGGSFTDPMSGQKVTRATDGRARHNYSRRQAWNADESYYLVYIVDDGGWELHDAATCKKLKTLPYLGGDNCEPLWHPTDPKLLWYMGDSLTWYEFDVDTGERFVLFTLDGRLPPEFAGIPGNTWAWTKSEGRASDDGSVLFLMLTSYSAATDVVWHGMVCVNPMTGEIYGAKATNEQFDHCSTTPSGRWGVYSGATTFAVDRTFTERRHLINGGQHSDLAIGPEGDDYYVYAQFKTADDDKDGANDDGFLMFHNIDTGEVDDLLGTYDSRTGGYTGYHISGQARKRPGYVVVSAYNDNRGSGTLGKGYRRVSIIELRKGGTQQCVTPIRQDDTGYFDEPQATCNRDLSKIMFASTMGPKSVNGGYSSSWIVDVPFKK